MKKIKGDISTIFVAILSVCALVVGYSALTGAPDNGIPPPPASEQKTIAPDSADTAIIAQDATPQPKPAAPAMMDDPLSLFGPSGQPAPKIKPSDTPIIAAAKALYTPRSFKTLAGEKLDYYWMEPEKSFFRFGRGGYPLLIVLHDAAGRAYAADYMASAPMRSDYPSFVAVPAIKAPAIWAHPDSRNAKQERLGDIEELIGDLLIHYPAIDRHRIYIAGCSMGGIGVFGAIARYPDLFAAGVPIAGNWDMIDAPIMGNTPMLIIHGGKDEAIPAAKLRAFIKKIRDNGGENLVYHELKSMPHNCSSPQLYSALVWRWLYAQKK